MTETTANTVLPKAVCDAEMMLSYAAQRGVALQQKDIENVVTARRAVEEKNLTKEQETEFWNSGTSISKAIFPVTLETLAASTPTLIADKSSSPAASAATRYRIRTIVTLAALLLFQIYWLIGATVVTDLKESRSKLEKITSQFYPAQRALETLVKQSKPENAQKIEELTTQTYALNENIWLERINVHTNSEVLSRWNIAKYLLLWKGSITPPATQKTPTISPPASSKSPEPTALKTLEPTSAKTAGSKTPEPTSSKAAEPTSPETASANSPEPTASKAAEQPKPAEAAGSQTPETAGPKDQEDNQRIKLTDTAFLAFNITNVVEMQTAQIILTALLKYILPLLYGALGASAFIVRSLANDIRDLTYSPESNVRYQLRFYLGAVAGFSIAWFTSDTKSAEAAGILQSLSPLALAFLAGYSVDLLFSLLDRLVIAFSAPDPKRASSAS